MIKTKHISLDDDCIKKVEPYYFKHGGNFSAAIREMLERAEETLPVNSIVVDEHLFDWLLDISDGRLVPDNVLYMIIDPLLINNMSDLCKFANKRFSKFGWRVNTNIKCDNIISPSNIVVNVTGASHRTRLVACMISQFIIKNFSGHTFFTIKSVISLDSETKVLLAQTTNKKEGPSSLTDFFGGFDEMSKAVKSHPKLWKCLVNRHVVSNYQMVTIHRNYYEDILSGKSPMGEIMIETIAKRPIKDIPLKEMIDLIKKVYEASRIVDKVDIHNEDIILFHTYRNIEVITKIKKQLIMLLEANGHTYDGEITTNMIVFKHRPDIGIKIDEIVSNLRYSESRLDKELIKFMTFLKDIDNLADSTTSISIFGKRIGIFLMQEYEKENNIKIWDLEIFKKAFTMVDSKIHRDSELELDGNNLLYRVRRCSIVPKGDKLSAHICRAAREAFKGAVNYAFGNKVDLEIKKLLYYGDNYCEVVIHYNDK